MYSWFLEADCMKRMEEQSVSRFANASRFLTSLKKDMDQLKM